jgi:hypothetical protein
MTPAELGKAQPASHENLAARFGGMLAPVTPTTGQADDAEPGDNEEPAPAPEITTPKTARRAATKRKSPTAVKPAPARPVETGPHPAAIAAVQISLPESVMSRLTAFKKTSGLSHPNILFDAIEATADQLAELIKESTVTVGSTGRSLFNRPQTVAKRSTDGEPKKTFIVRISEENKAIVDDLVEQTGAPSRNALITAAYEAYLPSTD